MECEQTEVKNGHTALLRKGFKSELNRTSKKNKLVEINCLGSAFRVGGI